MERKIKTYLFTFVCLYGLMLVALRVQHRWRTFVPTNCALIDEYLQLFIPSSHIVNEDIWLTVKSEEFYVFSAFLDTRGNEPVVKVMAVYDGLMAAYCQLWTVEDQQWTYHISRAEQYILPERNSHRLKGSILQCQVPESWGGRRVQYVTIVTRPCELRVNTTLIVKDDQPDNDTPKQNFTVCLSPLHSDFSDVTGFIEYMELNLMFGAEYFIVYNTSVSDSVQQVMESYREEGILEVVQWNSPPFLDDTNQLVPEIEDYGKAVSINDCLYRARLISRYAVITDIDEYIVPKINNSWMAVFQAVDREQHYSTYQFTRVPFEKTWGVRSPYSKNFFIQKYQLNSVLYTRRLPHDLISPRCICDTEKVKVAGVYKSLVYMGKAGHKRVDPYLAQLNHYRAWQPGRLLQSLYTITGVQPRYLWRFGKNDHTLLHLGELVIPRVLERLEKLAARRASSNLPYVEYREIVKYESYWHGHPWLKSVLFH